jgi:hypothetical protein
MAAYFLYEFFLALKVMFSCVLDWEILFLYMSAAMICFRSRLVGDI